MNRPRLFTRPENAMPIDPELLKKHLKQVKTGLPGVAWIKLDAQAQWPQHLAIKVTE